MVERQRERTKGRRLMPWKPKSPCPGKHGRCPNFTTGGLCDPCRLGTNRVRDAERPNASARGYASARWRKLRARKLAEHPLCDDCEKTARVTPATEVDHVKPHDGPKDPLFWEWQNLSSKCKSCHSRKTATQDGGFTGRRAS